MQMDSNIDPESKVRSSSLESLESNFLWDSRSLNMFELRCWHLAAGGQAARVHAGQPEADRRNGSCASHDV